MQTKSFGQKEGGSGDARPKAGPMIIFLGAAFL
jgi:hypothetical protein